MKTILAALVALAAVTFGPAEASEWGVPTGAAPFGVSAWGVSAAPPPGLCPHNTSFDGCLAAPAPLTARWIQPTSFQAGGYLNTTSASPTDYTQNDCGDSGTGPCSPATLWDQAGVAYAIGDYGTLTDPVATPPTGCTTPTLQSWGGLLMSCGGTNSSFRGVINNLELGNVNGHDCVAVNFNATTTTFTGSITGTTLTLGSTPATLLATGNILTASTGAGFSATKILGILTGSGLSGSTYQVDVSQGAASGTITANLAPALTENNVHFFNNNGECTTQTGGGQTAQGTSNNAFPGGITLNSVYADGNYNQFDDLYGSATCAASALQCNPVAFFGTGNNDITYNYSVVNHFAGRPIAPNQGGALHVNFSWLQGWNKRSIDGHSEVVNGGPTTGVQTAAYSIIMQETETAPFGPTVWFYNNNRPGNIAGLTFTGVTWISPWIGGATQKQQFYSGCSGAPPTGGTAVTPICGTGTDGKFYLTCLQSAPGAGCGTGDWGDGYGVAIDGNGGCTGSNPSGYTYKPIAGSYPIVNPGVPDILGEWGVDGFTVNQGYPNWNISGTCVQAPSFRSGAPNAVANGHPVPQFGPTVVTKNFFDAAVNGTPTPNIWTIEVDAQTSGWTGHIAANQLFVDSATGSIGVRSYIAGAGIDNCGSTLVATCPFVSSVTPAVNISNAVWSSAGIGQVTFTTTLAPSISIGNSFTVGGIVNSPTSPNLFNNTYVAIAGTGGSTVVGQLQSGATLGNAGTYSSGGSLTPLIYTLSASNASPVSTEAMTTHYPTICSVPSVFNNNTDMTGLLSPSYYEGWTNLPSPEVFGC